MSWINMSTEQRIDAVKSFLAEHPTARESEIVYGLGGTRESVRSTIRYYGIELYKLPKAKTTKPAEAVAPAEERPLPRRRGDFKFGKPKSDLATLPRDVDEMAFQPLDDGPAPKLLEHLGRHECHWPVGERVFCGLHAKTGRYCARHTKMSGRLVPRLVIR
jgi:hypothetical protein